MVDLATVLLYRNYQGYLPDAELVTAASSLGSVSDPVVLTVDDANYLLVKADGKAYYVTVSDSDSSVLVENGGQVENVTLLADGAMKLEAGASASAVTLEYGSMVTVYGELSYCSGTGVIDLYGKAMDITVSTGTAHIYDEEAGKWIDVKSVGSVRLSGKDALLQRAYDVTGTIDISAGSAVDISIASGGKVNMRGGAISNAVFKSGSSLFTTYGAGRTFTISDVSFQSGSFARLYSGTVLTGDISLGTAPQLMASIDASAATANFMLDGRSTEDAALISDWSLCAFGECAITISATQDFGIYQLAGNALEFDQDAALQLSDGTALGTLSVGKPMFIGEGCLLLGFTDEQALALAVDECSYVTVAFDAAGNEAVTVKSAVNAVTVYAPEESQVYVEGRKASATEWGECDVTGYVIGEGPQLLNLDADIVPDVLLPEACGVWGGGFVAKNTNTDECVSLKGMNRYDELVWARGDTTIIMFADGDDAIVADDIFTALPDEVSGPVSRFYNVTEIHAGAGNDLVDLTMLNADDANADIVVHGGAGDDILWGGNNGAILYGDEGNDVLVGGAGDDLLCGGEGDDVLRGLGGSNTYIFDSGWGHDTLELSDNEDFTLVFGSGISQEQLGVAYDADSSTASITCASDSILVKNVAAGGLDGRCIFQG